MIETIIYYAFLHNGRSLDCWRICFFLWWGLGATIPIAVLIWWLAFRSGWFSIG